MGAFLRKYGVAITAGTAYSIQIPIPKRASVDYAVSGDWTPAAGDVKISKDGGAAASIATLPAALTMGNTAVWEFVFSQSELQAKKIVVTVADASIKAVEDQSFIIETYGDANAMYAADMSAANLPANVVQFAGTNATAALGIPEVKVASIATAALLSIWEVATSTLTSAGTIGKRIVDYLTGDIFSRIGLNGAGLTAIGPVTLATSQPNYAPAKAGDAMTLTSGERIAIATAVETACINEADGNALLEAMTDAIAAANPDLSALSADLIAAAVRTNLATELGRIDVAMSTLATASALTTVGTNVSSALSSINTLKGDWDNNGRLDLLLDQAVNDSGAAITQLTNIGNAIDEVNTVASKLNDTLVDNSGTYRFTAAALALAPAGGGGGSAPTTEEITDSLVASDWAKRVAAVLYGKLAGAGTGEEIFYDEDGETVLVRVTATKRGNRTEVVFE